MKRLFLAAKKFAIDDNQATISIEHIKHSLDFLEITYERARVLIYEYLEIDPVLQEGLSSDDIEKAENHAKITFDSDVKKFKKYLISNGFNMKLDITKLYIKQENTISSIRKKINKLETSLKNKVFGQDVAIEAICDKIVESSYNAAKNAPKAIFFFLGPPATGKTMLSKVMSSELDGYGKFKIFDMTQFTSSNQGFALFGLEEGYRDAKEGKLTKFVKENPKSVVVFDEIEKAHSAILSNFLAMLSSGKVEDAYTEEIIDFTETIVVFTSNLGSEMYNNNDFLTLMKDDQNKANSIILEAISREEKIVDGAPQKAISAEFLSRLSQGQVVLFNKLSFDAFLEIATSKIVEVQNNFKDTYDIEIEYDSFEDIVALLVLSQTPMLDARKLKSTLPLMLFDLVTDYIRKNDVVLKKVKFIIDDSAKDILHKELLDLEPQEQTKFLHNLFRRNKTYEYKVSTEFKHNILNFTFSGLQSKQLEKSVDFTGEDALVFEIPKISFKDVAGHKVAKERLREIINILRESKKLSGYSIDIPKGMLLYGKPGTGKTMLAKAFAHEADLPFIQTTGSEILNIDLMKSVFKKAKEYAPSIVFIDEIDAIGGRGVSGYDVQINQFLTELNGFSDNEEDRVFIVAATNLKEKLDPAIIRSGRIDLHIEIDALDREARRFFIDKILKNHADGDFDRDKVLTYTAGMTGADLEKVSRESILYLFRHNLKSFTQDMLIEQINIVKYGSRITHKSIEKLIKSTAIHEAGHAVLSKMLMPEVKIEQITVVPRSKALGFVSYDMEDNFKNLTRENIKKKLCVLFAGREAQLREYGEDGFDNGASSDLSIATQIAYSAIAIWGMGENIGYINISDLDNKLFVKEIESEVKQWLNDAEAKTKKYIYAYWDKITKLAKILEENEIVNEKELLELLDVK